MKTVFFPLLLPLLSGCLTASQPDVSRWMLECTGGKPVATKAKYDVVRISQVTVRAPYGSDAMVVLRSDGTVARDGYNEFLSVPSSLLKGVAFDALSGSGLFGTVVGESSSAATQVSVEIVLMRLALDCRAEGRRQAVASALIRVVDHRRVAAVVEGEGSADAADGNYGAAFSKAVSSALFAALGKIR